MFGIFGGETEFDLFIDVSLMNGRAENFKKRRQLPNR